MPAKSSKKSSKSSKESSKSSKESSKSFNTKTKPSHVFREFLKLNPIERLAGMSNVKPHDLTEEETVGWEAFREERRTAKLEVYAANRVANGKASKKKPRSDMTAEELGREQANGRRSAEKVYAKRQCLTAFARAHGIKVPNLSHRTSTVKNLSEALANAGYDAAEIYAIGHTVVESRPYKKHAKLVANSRGDGGEMAVAGGKLKNREEDDADSDDEMVLGGGGLKKREEDDADSDDEMDAASDGEKKRGDDDAKMDEQEYKDELAAQSARRLYRRMRALYDRANDFAVKTMAPFNDMTILQIRTILLQNIPQSEIDEIEAEALRKDAEKFESVERRDRKSRSANRLNQFFEEHSDIPRVSKVGDLSPEDRKRYNRFLRSENLDEHRARDRAYDAAHREERAEAQRQRRLENPDALLIIQRRYGKTKKGMLSRFFKDTKTTAGKNGIPFEITKQEVKNMAKEPCYYCGEESEDYCVDAVDVATGFVQRNVVPCCQPCNRFKKDHHINDFLRIMCNIGATHLPSSETVQWTPIYEFVNTVKDKKSTSFSNYRSGAERRNLEFQMTNEQFKRLVNDPCHYCGILRPNATNGIDRVDSSEGYLSNNIVTCCGPCNLMKVNFAYSLFVDKAIKIMRMWVPRFNASAGFFDVSRENSAHKAGEE